MNGLRGEQADAPVVMFRVIPGEEALAEAAAVLDATKAVWEIGTVLERLEPRLGERVVIACIRPAVGLCHPQVGQKQCHRLGSQWSAVILRLGAYFKEAAVFRAFMR